ncbi:MAG: carbamoyltransferase [Verrucomicrobia bacterium]|nr:carbamoyltransferase [Verrucomicrobiota bacterium]
MSLILGVNAYNHNASASFVKDGQLVYAAEEERFNRVKHSDAFPALAIEDGLATIGAELREVTDVTYCWDWKRGARARWPYLAKQFWDPVTLKYVGGLDRIGRIESIRRLPRELSRLGLRNAGFSCVEHHLAHAASAFYPSPFEKAAVLTIDGVGEWETAWIGFGEGQRLTRLHTIPFPHSLGLAYDAICQILGFRKQKDTGKVMGLAAYGDPERYRDFFGDFLQLDPEKGFRVCTRYVTWPRYFGYGSQPLYSPAMTNMLGPPRHLNEAIESRHADIAAGMQRRFEEVMLHLCNHLHEVTQLDSLCLAGGCALNCLANERIIRETGFSKVFVFPAATDAGAGTGSAIKFAVDNGQGRSELTSVNLGPEPGDNIEKVLLQTNLPVEKPQDLSQRTAELLAGGAIVGWIQGRMEFGPRALGQRSLLADPRGAGMKEHMNSRVKHRESFRPFAPACPVEDAGTYFNMARPSPWMLFAPRVRTEWQDKLAAITHADGTARLQTVDRTDYPEFHRLLKSFGDLTGVPVLLNTSFNRAGEPVVATVADAVDCFLSTGIDTLVAGPYLVSRKSVASS